MKKDDEVIITKLNKYNGKKGKIINTINNIVEVKIENEVEIFFTKDLKKAK